MNKHIFERDLCIKTSVITSTYPFNPASQKNKLIIDILLLVESKSVKRTLNGNNMNLIRR